MRLKLETEDGQDFVIDFGLGVGGVKIYANDVQVPGEGATFTVTELEVISKMIDAAHAVEAQEQWDLDQAAEKEIQEVKNNGH